MLLIIDNFDSFTYNLVQYFGQLGIKQKVVRNNEINIEEALEFNPDRVVISPGPRTPKQAGISLDIIASFAGKAPLLGVCLGHQCIAQHFGAKIVCADRLMHGKCSLIEHQEEGLFSGIKNPFSATRYHSLIVERESFPDCLEITAETKDKEIMGLKHKQLPVWGVQFHPESLATENGIKILENFLRF
jgi:anthranilate synthase/aminodeoxychorismate synthase-like glutamine amidotransferase